MKSQVVVQAYYEAMGIEVSMQHARSLVRSGEYWVMDNLYIGYVVSGQDCTW